MCTAKAPKQAEVKEKKVQYLSNPWIDGLGIAGSQSRGRNSLRTDLPQRATTNPPLQNTYDPGVPDDQRYTIKQLLNSPLPNRTVSGPTRQMETLR